MTSIVSIGTVILQSLLISLEQPLSVHRSQPSHHVLCRLPITAIMSVSQPLSHSLVQSNSADPKRCYIASLLSWSLICLGCCSSILLGWSLTSFISVTNLSHCKCQSLSQISSLLLSYFGESHHPENALQGMGKGNPHISFIELFGKIFFVLWIIPHTGYMGSFSANPYLVPHDPTAHHNLSKKSEYQLLTE